MTIKEIAILAKTSRGTVDRVINNRGKVSKDVEKRVLDVIKATNYRPNEIGRSLSLSNKRIKVGVIIGAMFNPFFNLVLDGIVNTADKYKNAGISVVVKKVDAFNRKAILKSIDQLQKEDIDSLIISAINDFEIVNKVNSLHIPVITISMDLDVEHICFVGCDYYNSGKLAANFANLVKGNGKNIGIVVGSSSHSGQALRVKGFKEIINNDINIVDFKENRDDDSISFKVVKDMVENHPEIEMIVFLGAGIDGGLQALKEYGNRIKAITVDQSNEVEKGLQTGLVLATITQHPYTQGVKTIEILYDYLIRKKRVAKEKILDNSIVLKESIIPHKLSENI